MLSSNKLSASFVPAVAGIAAGLLCSGCASPPPGPRAPTAEVEQVAAYVPPPRPAEPAMNTAGDAQMTIFGELPDQSRVPFVTRAASPMRQHSFTAEGADFDVDVSPDGQWIVFSSTRHTANPDLYLKRAEGQAVTQLTSDPAPDVQPCFHPDGKRILFASLRSGNWDIWTVQLHGGQATQMTRSPMHEVHPSVSPDGGRLVYCMFNERSEQWELWIQQLSITGARRMIGVGLFPEWSPNAESVVYQRARERGGRWFSIWRVDLDNGEPQFPIEIASRTDAALIQPNWSPDGQWITYGTARLSDDPGQMTPNYPVMSSGDIWIVKADGSEPMQLTDGGGKHFGSVWGPKDQVFFTSMQNGSENIWSVQPLLAGTPDNLPKSNDSTASTGSAAENASAREGS